MSLFFSKDFEVSAVKSSGHVMPNKLYLGSASFSMGDFPYADDETKMYELTFGSDSGIFAEQDTFRFWKDTSKICLIYAHLSNSVILSDVFLNVADRQQCEISALKKKTLYINSCDSMIYFRLEDALFGHYPETFDISESVDLYSISANFSLVFRGNMLVGWLIEKVSETLSVGDEIAIFVEDMTPYLERYFKLCNREMYDLMDDEDAIIKGKLVELKHELEQCKSDGSKSILKGVNGFLEGYYSF